MYDNYERLYYFCLDKVYVNSRIHVIICDELGYHGGGGVLYEQGIGNCVIHVGFYSS